MQENQPITKIATQPSIWFLLFFNQHCSAEILLTVAALVSKEWNAAIKNAWKEEGIKKFLDDKLEGYKNSFAKHPLSTYLNGFDRKKLTLYFSTILQDAPLITITKNNKTKKFSITQFSEYAHSKHFNTAELLAPAMFSEKAISSNNKYNFMGDAERLNQFYLKEFSHIQPPPESGFPNLLHSEEPSSTGSMETPGFHDEKGGNYNSPVYYNI
jgi:hypothetical protein